MADEITDEVIEEVTYALKHYLYEWYKDICDYETVIRNRKEIIIDVNGVETTIYAYECPCQTVYLNSLHYPMSYGRQHIVNDEYYYDFNIVEDDDAGEDAGTYTYINTTEWKKTDIAG